MLRVVIGSECCTNILCAGLGGMDTHRLWEALLLGSIPVVEASPTGPGWERSFSLLPVLVVTDLLAVRGSLPIVLYSSTLYNICLLGIRMFVCMFVC